MNSSSLHNFRGAFSAVLAAAIVGTSSLALESAHPDLPKGVVEVGELTLVGDLAPAGVLPKVVQLPEVTVRATRVALASDSGRA